MKPIHRILALMMALILVFSTMGGMTLTASAAEDDVYVLNYNGQYEGSKWQYFSPYWPAFEYEGAADYTQSIAFTLYDTKNAEPLAAYCLDIAVGLDNDSDFRRINLEDSTYTASAAGLLRSIVLKGYPNTTAEALGAAAGVENLTVGEAVAATQAAIWQAAHGDRLVFTDFCDTIDTDWASDATAHFAECYAEIESGYAVAGNEATIEAHIEEVFNYLVGLAPAAPTGVVASQASFVQWDSVVTDNGDGTCNVTATATVNVVVNEGDSLTLSAAVGEYAANTALENGQKDYTLTIENVPADVAGGAVTLAIDGVQAVADVYLFDAVGGRGTSQSLIGITDNPLPVHAEVNANDRVLIVNKTDDGVGLQNIVFDIYYVCSVKEYVNGEVVLGTGIVTLDGVDYFSAPTEADIAKYVTGEVPVASITTDENGQAYHNFGNDNDGIYLVVERENSVTTGAISPFFVAIPGGASADATDVYEIQVQPKNTVIEEDVEIEKDVTEIDNQHDTYAVGEEHTWIVQSSIPEGLGTGLKYQVSDTLDSRLTLKGIDQVSVAYDDGAFGDVVEEEKTEDAAYAETFLLVEGEDYTVALENDATDGNGKTPADKFTVDLTAAGRKKVVDYVGDAFTNYEIRIYFTAVINTSAGMGEEIPNKGHVEYINNVGKEYDADSDVPEVHTGGAQLLKVDAINADKKLVGAAFQVYRPATEEEIAAGGDGIEHIDIEGVSTAVIRVSFYDNAEMEGDKVTQVVSDEEGKGVIYGLAYGTYYLVETDAPAGYNLLTEPVAMTVTATSHTDAAVITVYNSAQFQLPETGGIGTAVFTFGGISIMALAAFLLLCTGRKRSK